MSERGGRNLDQRAPMRRDPTDPHVDPPADLVKSGQTGARVTVACKLPHGLILRLGRMVKRPEPVMGGGVREVEMWEPTGERQVIRGNRVPYGVAPSWPIVGDYGLTHNVPKDFWEQWLAQNKRHPMVMNHLLFAYEDAAKANEDAKDHAELRSGLEPLDPDNLPRGLGARGQIGSVSQIETANNREP